MTAALTESDLPTLQRSLAAVASGLASVSSVPPLSISRALCNWLSTSRTWKDEAIGDLQKLNEYVHVVNISCGTCTTAALMASWEACKIAGDFEPLRSLCALHVQNDLDAAQASLIAAIGLPLPAGESLWSRLVDALNRNPNYAQAWYAAYSNPVVVPPVQYKDETFTDKMHLLLRAVSCPDALAVHWYALGCAMTDPHKVSTVTPHGPLTRRDCFAHAVKLDPSWGDAFFELAKCMPCTDSVRLTNREGQREDVDVVRCLARAIELGCRHTAAAWYGLMNTIGSATHYSLAGLSLSLAYCCAKVIETVPNAGLPSAVVSAWLGEAWEVLLECFERMPHDVLDASLSAASQNLTKVTCAAQVATRYPADSAAWITLGRALEEQGASATTTVKSERFNSASAFAKALQCDPKAIAAWLGLAKTLRPNQTVSLNGKPVGRVDAAFKVSAQFPHRVDSWELYSALFDRSAFVDLPDGTLFSRKDWCARILELEPQHVETLYRMACTLGSGGDAALLSDGRTLTVRNCLVDCLTADESFTAAWVKLNESMGLNEKVTVNGRVLTKTDVEARVRAAGEYDLAENWIALGRLLRQRNGVQTVGRQTVTAIDCFAKALDLDPGNSEAANCMDLCLQDVSSIDSAAAAAPPAPRSNASSRR